MFEFIQLHGQSWRDSHYWLFRTVYYLLSPYWRSPDHCRLYLPARHCKRVVDDYSNPFAVTILYILIQTQTQIDLPLRFASNGVLLLYSFFDVAQTIAGHSSARHCERAVAIAVIHLQLQFYISSSKLKLKSTSLYGSQVTVCYYSPTNFWALICSDHATCVA